LSLDWRAEKAREGAEMKARLWPAGGLWLAAARSSWRGLSWPVNQLWLKATAAISLSLCS